MFMFFNFSPNTAEAQCLACHTSIEGGDLDCKTELVGRDGFLNCGCSPGCSCSGECEYDDDQNDQPGEAFLYYFNEENKDIEIPTVGLLVNSENGIPSELEGSLTRGGLVGDSKVEEVAFGDNIAIYKMRENKYLLFPVVDNKFLLKDCNGEILAEIRKPELITES